LYRGSHLQSEFAPCRRDGSLVKPIGFNMAGQIARDAERRRLPLSGEVLPFSLAF
jgi:hypothetical protein